MKKKLLYIFVSIIILIVMTVVSTHYIIKHVSNNKAYLSWHSMVPYINYHANIAGINSVVAAISITDLIKQQRLILKNITINNYALPGKVELLRKNSQYILNGYLDNFINISAIIDDNIIINAKVQQTEIAKILNLVRKTKVKHHVSSWLLKSLQHGTITGGKLHYDKNNNDLRWQLKFSDASCDYTPKWPQVNNANGIVAMQNSDLIVKVHRSKILNNFLEPINLVVNNIGTKVPSVLKVTGEFNGDLINGLEFLANSPLNDIAVKLKPLHFKGAMQVKLQLALPMSGNDKISIRGKLAFKDASAALADKITGILHFSEHGIRANKISLQLLEYDATLDLYQDKTALHCKLDSYISAKELNKYLPANIEPILSGGASYNLQIVVPSKQHKAIKVTAVSNLDGMEIRLPAPMHKPLETVRDLKITAEINLHDNKTHISATLDKTLDLQLALRKNKIHVMEARVHKLKVLRKNLWKNILLHYSDNKKILQIKNDNIVGTISWPKNMPKLININFSKLSLVPQQNLGKITAVLQSTGDGYNIKELSLKNAATVLTAHGKWNVKNNHTQLAGNITSNDLSRSLAALEYNTAIKNSKAKINFDLHWQAGPLSLDLASLGGIMAMELKGGSIIGVDPGLGRVLGLLSLDNITRRLKLDFSDLATKGLAVDYIKTDATFKHGIASTKDLMVMSPVAEIHLRGNTNLIAQTLDLEMAINPKIASSVPIAAMVATGNPVIGIAIWLFDKTISTGKSNRRNSSYGYVVSGTWDDPKIKERKAK